MLFLVCLVWFPHVFLLVVVVVGGRSLALFRAGGRFTPLFFCGTLPLHLPPLPGGHFPSASLRRNIQSTLGVPKQEAQENGEERRGEGKAKKPTFLQPP